MHAEVAPPPNRSTGENGLFDPFQGLMVMQASRPAHLERINLRTLSPFQRALLAIDGTVTTFIESYTLEPIETMLLSQGEQPLSSDHPWLGVSASTRVIARQVILRGRYSSAVYAYATSLLVPTQLPANMVSDLKVEPGGLGRVLLNKQIENRREVLWYGREQIPDLPAEIEQLTGHDFISRTYRIIVQGMAAMLINEKFPVALVQPPGT